MGQPLPLLVGSNEPDLKILRDAFHASAEGMALVEDGRIYYVHRAFAKLLSHSKPSEVEGKLLASLRPQTYPCALAKRESSCNVADTHLCQFVTRRKEFHFPGPRPQLHGSEDSRCNDTGTASHGAR